MRKTYVLDSAAAGWKVSFYLCLLSPRRPSTDSLLRCCCCLRGIVCMLIKFLTSSSLKDLKKIPLDARDNSESREPHQWTITALIVKLFPLPSSFSLNFFLGGWRELFHVLYSRGVGEGSTTTAMTVLFIGTSKLLDTNLFLKKKEKKERNGKKWRIMKEKKKTKKRESKLFIMKQWQYSLLFTVLEQNTFVSNCWDTKYVGHR